MIYGPAQGVIWSEAEQNKALALSKNGKTAREIGVALNRSRNSVIGLLHRHKIKQGHVPVPRKFVPRPHELVDQALLKQLHSEGQGARAIAAGLGISRFRARSAILSLGLTPNYTDNPLNSAVAARVKRMAARQNFNLGSPDTATTVAAIKRFAEGHEGQSGKVGIYDLKGHHCRFPIDQPDAPIRFCGDQRVEHSSYCESHNARCVDSRHNRGAA